MANPNLFTDLPSALPEELFTHLLQTPGIRIERIVSQGHKSADGFWYDQPTGEWVIVLKGAARIEFEDSAIDMGPGDYLDIPGPQEAPRGLDNAGRAHDLAGGVLRQWGIEGRRGGTYFQP